MADDERIESGHLIALIGRLRSHIGVDWLDREVDRVLRWPVRREPRRFHPVVVLYAQVERQLKTSATAFAVSWESLALADLARAVEVLEAKSVTNLGERLDKLSSNDFDEAASTIYELECGAAYIMAGHSVAFLRVSAEQRRRRADLMVDGQVEVECKRKRALEFPARQSLYELAARRVDKLLEGTDKGVRVETYTRGEPSRIDIERSLALVRRVIEENGGGALIDEVDYYCRVEQVKNGVYVNGLDVQVNGPRGRYDHVLLASGIRPYVTFVELKNPRACLFKCGVRDPDQVRSAIRTLQKAKSQLSASLPGVVHLDVSKIDREEAGNKAAEVVRKVEGYLRSTTSVSGAIITAEGFEYSDGAPRLWKVHRLIANPKAKNVLPTGLNFRWPGVQVIASKAI